MRKATGIVRIAAGVFAILVLQAHLVYSLGSGGSALPNFFSYFTMQSAIAASILWLVGGAITLRSSADPRPLVTARMLVTTYQLVSGVVYTIIVIQAVSRDLSIQVPVSSQILHYWLPAFALVDWLLAPRKASISWRALTVVLAFPLAWGGFTMTRGAIVGWYPYFFLDPYQVSGPGEFVAYCSIVLAFILGVAALLILASRYLPRPPRRAATAATAASAEVAAGSDGDEGLEAHPRALHDLVVVDLGERSRPIAAD